MLVSVKRSRQSSTVINIRFHMNLLLIKTSSLGDVIHMLPAVSDAVKAIPDLRIDWLVEQSFAAIPAWHPGVGQVIPIAVRRWKKHLTSLSTWQHIAAVRSTLRSHSYDMILDSQGLLKSAIWTWMANGPAVGYDRYSIREPLASWFYDRRLSVSRNQHAIDRNRQVMAQAFGYKLPSSGPDYGLQGLSNRLPAPGIAIPPGSVIGLHGTSRPDKLWPVENWVLLAQKLGAIHRTLVLPWGNEEERQRAEYIANHSPAVQVLPRLGLDALACILDQSQAAIGVDTGLLHLAAALGKPGLALYTATPPALTGAVSDRHAASALRNLSSPQELQASSVIDALMTTLYKC